MPSPKDELRQELSFRPEEKEQFKIMAQRDGRNLKNWMEWQLRKLLPKPAKNK